MEFERPKAPLFPSLKLRTWCIRDMVLDYGGVLELSLVIHTTLKDFPDGGMGRILNSFLRI